MTRSMKLVLAVASLMGLLGGLLFGSVWLNRPTPAVSGIVLPDARPLPDFVLTDHHGQPFGPDRLRGKWSLLSYGYTHCPDICPTTLASLKQAAERLQRDNPEAYAQTRFLFLTVDPARDSIAQLARYVPYFHPDFLGLRGEPDAVQGLHQALGIVAIVNPPADSAKPGNYSVDHGVAMYLLDPQGRLAAILRPEGPGAAAGAYAAERLVADLLAVQAAGER